MAALSLARPKPSPFGFSSRLLPHEPVDDLLGRDAAQREQGEKHPEPSSLGGVVARASAAVVAAQDLAHIASDGALGKLGGPPARTLDAVARRVREGAAAGAGLGVCGGVRASGC